MVEWWTYVPSDFQLFSGRTYARLVQAHNQALWPAQLLMAGCGAVALLGLLTRRRGAAQLLAGLAALWCITVAWDFLLLRYAQIHWGAPVMAVGFAAQAVVLAVLARRGAFTTDAAARERAVAVGLLLVALAGAPLLAGWLGGSWWRAEVVGLMPAPTVLAMLALAPLARPGVRRWLLPLPLAWCVVEPLMLLALQAPQWPLLPLAALLSLAARPARRGRAPAAQAASAQPAP
ncbi:DUF6064 family protein, partial [Azohydromonas lata]